MEFTGVLLGFAIALTLAGNGVNKHRLPESLDIVESVNEVFDLVAINGPHIVEAQIFK